MMIKARQREGRLPKDDDVREIDATVFQQTRGPDDWDQRLVDALGDLNAQRPPWEPEWSVEWSHEGTAVNGGGTDEETEDMVDDVTYQVGRSSKAERQGAIRAQFERQRLKDWTTEGAQRLMDKFLEATEICPLFVSELQECKLPKMRINVKTDRPVRRTYGQRHKDHTTELQKMVDEMETAGVVERRASEWGFPLLLVWQNGKPRLCHDLRGLNAVLEQDNAQMPLITESLQRAARGRWFTKLDMRKGYWPKDIFVLAY